MELMEFPKPPPIPVSLKGSNNIRNFLKAEITHSRDNLATISPLSIKDRQAFIKAMKYLDNVNPETKFHSWIEKLVHLLMGTPWREWVSDEFRLFLEEMEGG